MRRDSGFFSSPALTDQVNFFNNNLSELKSSVALFNALVSDVEKFCCQNSEEIKANKKLNALLSNLLNKSSELQQPMATRKIMRLRYLAADDRDRFHYISYYLKEYEVIFSSKRGITLEEISCAFAEIQTELENKRTLEDAGVHLAEELGEFSEAILAYRGKHNDSGFENIILEAADLFSCYMTLYESAGINAAEELSKTFSDNCHVCKKSPCQCSFEDIMGFDS